MRIRGAAQPDARDGVLWQGVTLWGETRNTLEAAEAPQEHTGIPDYIIQFSRIIITGVRGQWRGVCEKLKSPPTSRSMLGGSAEEPCREGGGAWTR